MISRRHWLAGFAATAVGMSRIACSRPGNSDGCSNAEAGGPKAESSLVRMHEMSFDKSRGGPQKAVVIIPTWVTTENPAPLLVALHGLGESNRGLDVGAWAWARDYWLDRCLTRLQSPPLQKRDTLNIATDSHLDTINQSIQRHPWRGLVVVCPYTPDILTEGSLNESSTAVSEFARFVVENLVPDVESAFPVIGGRSATGIDGVSLGGRMAMLVAAARPEAFRSLGTIQAAVRDREVQSAASIVQKTWDKPVHPDTLRILTSVDDPFLPALRNLAKKLESTGLQANFDAVPGGHNYEFNRGLGGYHMLLWHDKVLRTKGS